jgi:flavin-binding protein dodecin
VGVYPLRLYVGTGLLRTFFRRASSRWRLHAIPGSAKYARVADSDVEERIVAMTDSVYRVTEVIGVSSESWEAAARSAVETAANTVRDLRIAEVVRQDVAIENGTIKSYRVRLAISFKYESSD